MTRGARWAAWVAATVVLVANAWPNFETTVDDAWISARYAQHLVEGHGLVYNAGEPPVEGYTNLAWVLLLALAHALKLPIYGTLTWGGLAFAALGLAAALPLTARLAGGWHPLVLLAPLLIAASPHYAVAATNGLETSMFAASVMASLALTLGATSPGRRAAAGAALGLLGTVRPEGMGIALILGAWHLLEHRHRLRKPGTWIVPAMAVAGVVAIETWRWSTYGDLVPNTLPAKSDVPLIRVILLNIKYLAIDGWFWFVALGLIVVAPLLPPRTAERGVVAIVTLLITAVPFRIQMWMPAGRLLVPAWTIALCSLTAVAASSRGARRAAVSLGLVALTLATLLSPVNRIMRSYDRTHSVLADNQAARAARHLRQHAPEGVWFAIRDAGVLAYHVGPRVRVAELHDRALSLRHPGGADTDVSKVPTDPAFLALTQTREDATSYRYLNDEKVFLATRQPYVYLGRVYQHQHRYFDLYARADLGVPPLPESVVLNRLGPDPPRR